MKLIQQLERKLSWRRKHRPPPTTPGITEAKQRKEAKKRQQLMAAKNAAAIKVSDSEFSSYISFGSGLRTVPLNAPSSCTSSYEVVAIRTRAPFQSVAHQSPPQSPSSMTHTQSPSPCREDEPESGHGEQMQVQQKDEHIYDQLDCHRRLSPPQNLAWCPETPEKMYNQKTSPTTSSGSNSSSQDSHYGPMTSASRRRRNRIKTNPWFASSPWATKNVDATQQEKENIYESIENLLNDRKIKELDNQNVTQTEQKNTYSRHLKCGTYLKRKAPPRMSLTTKRSLPLETTYPTSPYHTFAQLPVEDTQQLLPSPVAHPSVEFLNKSQQLCRQISSYFESQEIFLPPSPPQSPPREWNISSTTRRPSLVGKDRNSLFGSMETIDLSPDLTRARQAHLLSEWSLAAEDDDDLTIFSPPTKTRPPVPPPRTTPVKSPTATPSPPVRSKKKSTSERPESIYSSRQSKKVNKLKCQLKEVVHAAIQQAKKNKA